MTAAGRALVPLAAAALLAAAAAWTAHGPAPRHAAAAAHLHEAGTDAADPPQEHVRPATSLRLLSCQPLPDIPGKAMTQAIVNFPPRAFTPAHRHPGAVMAHVLRGTVRSRLAGDAARSYGPGDTWFEPPGALHVFAENPSDEPAEVLATFIADQDCGALVIFEP
ncbi:MAG: cupin domain-containing protein [Pseudomonadota bacterium]|jgi:quercetin dioxygenase-like cupin family protein|nr:MAG: cupin domain-containing protein [Pseudomonadota bacterium]